MREMSVLNLSQLDFTKKRKEKKKKQNKNQKKKILGKLWHLKIIQSLAERLKLILYQLQPMLYIQYLTSKMKNIFF